MLGIYCDVSRIFWASRSILFTPLKGKNIFLQTIQHSLTKIKSGITEEEKNKQQKTSAIWNSYRICSNFFLETQLVFLDVMCRERNLRERGFVILSVSQPHSLDNNWSSFSVLFCVALFVQGMILWYNLWLWFSNLRVADTKKFKFWPQQQNLSIKKLVVWYSVKMGAQTFWVK